MSQAKPDLAAFAAEERDVKVLRDQRDAALRKLDAYKREKGAIIEAYRAAAFEAVDSIVVPRIKPPVADRRKRSSEVAVAVLSDWQLAKKTTTYSSDICAARIREYAQKVISLTDLQRKDHPVDELRVYLLGDLVEGELIFPGQSHLIDGSLNGQVMRGVEILVEFLLTMVGYVRRVHVVGVGGNHGEVGGRSRRDSHPETNMDVLVMQMAQRILRDEPRITWGELVVPNERKWYALDTIGEKTFFMVHGQQVKGSLGFPWYGFGKKMLGWRDKFGFDYALSGHYHTPARNLYGGLTHWSNGSTESDNTYALEWLAAQGTPSQWLLFCHPKRGVTAEYEVHLT